MKQAGKHYRHHTVLTRLLHNRNSYRTSSILLQTTNHFVTVAPSPSSFLPFVSLLPILRIPIRCCNQRRNKFFRKENRRQPERQPAMSSHRNLLRQIPYEYTLICLRTIIQLDRLPLRICRYLTNAIASKRFIRFKRSCLNGTLRERQCSSHHVLSSSSRSARYSNIDTSTQSSKDEKRALKPS